MCTNIAATSSNAACVDCLQNRYTLLIICELDYQKVVIMIQITRYSANIGSVYDSVSVRFSNQC